MTSFEVVTPPATEPVSVSEVLQYCRIDSINQEPAPGAVTVATASGAGNVDNGAHRYLCTFVTAEGETQAGAISGPKNIIDKTVNGKISLTNIPTGGSQVVARKIYRTVANGTDYLFLATISDNTTTTYTDNTADASLGSQAPTQNTTGDPLLRLLITSARLKAEHLLNRFLISQTMDMYLDSFPSEWINLPPLQSVSSISYIDEDGNEQTLPADQYQVDSISKPAGIAPAYGLSWPIARAQTNAVKIRFIAGYGDASAVPACIKQWILLRVKEAYDNRQAVAMGSIQLVEFPYSYVDGLLDPERIYGY